MDKLPEAVAACGRTDLSALAESPHWSEPITARADRARREAPFTLAMPFATLFPMATGGKPAKPPAPPDTGELLTSRDNRWLKEFRLALRGGVPTAGECVGVEGVRLVEEALRTGLPIEAVLFSATGERHRERLDPLLRTLAGAPLRVLRTTDRLFAGVADTETPQGVAALVRPRQASFDDLMRRGPAELLIVLLAGVQDPGNVGTILRTAEAFGATGAAACASGHTGTANPLAPKALRASAGAALRLPILHGVAISILLAQLRVAGVRVYAASSEASEMQAPPLLRPGQADWSGPCAVLIGNEGSGLPAEIEKAADARLRIPIASAVESLNAAVAAAVLLYEAARQRGLV